MIGLISQGRIHDELQGPDLNQRPSGYEPDELPDCSTLRQYGSLCVKKIVNKF